MSDLNSKKNKHMTFDDRHEIQQCLDHGMTFKAIAARIGKDQTTVSKEVKKHLKVTATETVKHTDSTGKPVVTPPCPQLLKATFVCNGCKKRRTRCGFVKQLYLAKTAHEEYRDILAESREGIALNKAEFFEMDTVLSEGIKKGQHLYHIMQSNDLGISQATAYRHLHNGYLSVSKLDFPRVVKFKKRSQPRKDYIPKSAKVGRTYNDFIAYVEEHNISSWVEMDTVPKGESFDHFTQDTVNLIFSHVNSVKRKSLNGKSPYDMFAFMHGDKLASLLGITKIQAKEVIQSPALLNISN